MNTISQERQRGGDLYKINMGDQQTVHVSTWGHTIDHIQHQCGSHTHKDTKQNAANACLHVYAYTRE